MEKDALKPVIEALIFAADHPLTLDKIAGVMEGVEKDAVKAALKELVTDYEADAKGIYIEEVAGGFQLRTKVANAPWIKRLFKIGTPKMSRAGIETLAMVAYKQPITRAELEAIRGVDSAGVLKTLLERRLVKIVGRQEVPGRPVMYGTTKEFLETFNLRDLAGLPTLKDIETLEKEFNANAYGEEAVEGEGVMNEMAEEEIRKLREEASEETESTGIETEGEAGAEAGGKTGAGEGPEQEGGPKA
ncbi:MAG: SMC-Scp complex subunit ScpB [Deltaproteobacteria bacterium]|nr:SMC-Scp complex subunit ScpB [Deltaproteobacteria bacterium]